MFANPHTAALIAEMNKATPGEHWLEALRGGTHVLIRPVCAQDHQRLLAFFQRLSPLSLRFRFLGAIAHVDDSVVDAFMSVPDDSCMVYVALIHNFGELQIIGISRYRRLDDPHACGCAVAVADAWQRKGLGRLLLTHLITAARRNGFEQMTSTDLSTDYPVHRLYKRLGFTSAYLGKDFERIVHDLRL
ncbi:GNAT family N-acetyltransferase [Pseudomonas sp. GD03842]|uniref:GNAT family N-acetyltransferase n=1 Tax=unclassified Pseudomonas TaxID=196821 RepID=UPI000D3A4432|nr:MULTISPECIES: GNAT family N-acetyltransferase [unclassified Pseudomonas]MDH0747205.1 GNAT family N-acetyltransferase [Pseudomonas sp. GD03842]RAU42272.1 N-acetyltransferase [Pseudomonas sp. RIT 409]RAU55079.1 N-acetyltransferase [Pseudomonas sp. RIT 412]